jgi:hypothetical protein
MEKDKITYDEFLDLQIEIKNRYNDGDLILGPYVNHDKITSDHSIKFPLYISSSGKEIVDANKTYIYSKSSNIFAKNLNKQSNNTYTII